jgi:hypothetical protein
MLSGEWIPRMVDRKSFNIQHLAFNIPVLFMLIATVAAANELSVDKRSLQLDDTITITITLEDSFAKVDTLRVPLKNLVIDGGPAVSSQFEWINGRTSRRKVFRYTAHPTASGSALVGPLTLHGSDGQVETLAPISIQVLPDPAAGTNDPLKIIHEMLATNREPIFLVAQADKTSVFTGEEVVVSWTLYNGASVQQYGIGEIPKLEDFWTEELHTNGDQPQQVVLGGVVLQKVAVRRAAIFPLRSGRLIVGSMGINASMMKRMSGGDPFGLFEGVVVDVHRRSAPLVIDVRPLPPGAAVAAVGDVTLQCGTPMQRNGGPLSLDVTMSGRANLRAATPPEWQTPMDGTVQINAGKVIVDRSRGDATMTRNWRYLVFPAHSGAFTLPALAATVLTPAGTRRQLRCEAKTLNVQAASVEDRRPHVSSQTRHVNVKSLLPWIAGGVAILLVLLLTIPRVRRSRRLRSEVRLLVQASPEETRAAVDAHLRGRAIDPVALLQERSDRGDAYRSLRSLLDAAQRDRFEATPREIADRIRDVLAAAA